MLIVAAGLADALETAQWWRARDQVIRFPWRSATIMVLDDHRTPLTEIGMLGVDGTTGRLLVLCSHSGAKVMPWGRLHQPSVLCKRLTWGGRCGDPYTGSAAVDDANAHLPVPVDPWCMRDRCRAVLDSTSDMRVAAQYSIQSACIGARS